MVGLDLNFNGIPLDNLNDLRSHNLSDNFLYTSVYSRLFDDLDIDCAYHDEISLSNLINNNKNSLSCFSLNVQSFPSKYVEFKNLLSNLSKNKCVFDIVCLSETWLRDFSRYQLTGYNIFFASRTSDSHGGSAIFLKKDIIATQIFNENFMVNNLIEATAVRINFNGFKCIILSIYRPNTHLTLNNSDQLALFFTKFNLILEFLDTLNTPVLITGDFNVNLFNLNDPNGNASLLMDMVTPFGYLQTINRATRIDGPSFTCIDHCYIKDLLPKLICTGVLALDISDHYGTFVLLRTDKAKKPRLPSTKKRLITEETKRSFFNALSALSWIEVTSLDDPSDSYKKFIEIFMLHYNLNFPLVNNVPNKQFIPQQPFMTTGLLKCRAIKENLSRASKASPLPHLINNYKKYRNIYSKCVRTAQKLYTRHQISDAKGDPRKIWSVLKDALRLPKKSNQINKIIIDDDVITNNIQIANEFNSFFSNIGPSIANTVPSTNAHFSDFLPPPCPNSFFMEPINENVFFNYILSTKPKLGLDDNDISMRMIHDMAIPLTKPLCYIFNQSISLSTFPELMKTSRCIPILKKGSPFSVENYRGVVMVNGFAKIFEKIFSDRLINFLEETDFFIDKQFGFRKGTSTAHALTAILNEITARLNEDKLVLALFCDIQKCFDSLDRSILFRKLENAGIRGHVLDWIKSYFSNRKQRVFVNGSNSSSTLDILFGVLQGSILGVLFFLIYINDIPNASQTINSFLFADDNSAIISAPSLHELILSANTEIDSLLHWYKANKLSLHPQKTKAFIFTTPRANLNLNIDTNGRTFIPIFLNMNNANENDISKIIPVSLIPNNEETSVRVLGILIDNKLNYKDHFKYLHGKLTKAIFSLRIMRHILDQRHLKLLYSSYLKSAIEYGSLLFSNVAKITLNPIIIMQKKAIRIICSAQYRAHTAPLFKQEKILPFEELIFYNICRFMFDYNKDTLPIIFKHTWLKNNEVHRYPVRNQNDFFIAPVNKPFLSQLPLFQFPKSWNSLPTEIKTIDSRKVFAKTLHKHLIDNIAL